MADVKNHSTLPTNLVSYWGLEESSGTRYDLHGSNDLTDNNTVVGATGKIGNGADFERGNSESLSIADNASLSITGDFSISAWIKLESLPSVAGEQYNIITKFATGAGNPRGYYLAVNGGNELNVLYRNASDQTTAIAAQSNAFDSGDLGTWVHVACAVDVSAATAALYINGSSVTATVTEGSATSIVDSTAAFHMGSFDTGGATTGYFDGVIDELGIWSRILTSGEITALYNGGDGLPYYDPVDVKNDTTLSTSLVSYYELEESSGTRTDSHGSNDLTDNNTVLGGTGIQGGCADLEMANSEYLSHADNADLSPTGDFSFNMWVKPENFTTTASGAGSANPFVEKLLGAGNQRSFVFAIDYGNGDATPDYTYRAAISSDGSSLTTKYSTAAQFNMTEGAWQMMTFIYDASAGEFSIYRNNSLEVTLTGFPTSVYDSTSQFNLGAAPNALVSYFDGLLDEVGYWKKVLTSSEISALYNSGSGIPYEAAAATSIKSVNGLAHASIKSWNGVVLD